MRYHHKVSVFIVLIIGLIAFTTSLYSAGIINDTGNRINIDDANLNIDGDMDNAGILNAGTGTINLDGNWTSTGTFDGGSSGSVIFSGSADSIIFGSNTFTNLTSTQAGKVLSFEAGTEQNITGTLTLIGSSGDLILLRSTVAGTHWSVDPQGARNISFVDVKDSNNVNSTIMDPSNSVDSGNNTNWFVENQITPTPTVTVTLTPTPTLIPTITPIVTTTLTPTPTATVTITPTLTLTPTATVTPTLIPTVTPIATVTPTLTAETPILTATPTQTPLPTQIPTITTEPSPIPTLSPPTDGLTLTVNPAFLESSLIPRRVIVTAIDQDGNPRTGVNITTTLVGRQVTVRPSSAETGPNGTATFRVRFGVATRNGEVLFSAEDSSVSVVRE